MNTNLFYKIKPIKEKLWLSVRRENPCANWMELAEILHAEIKTLQEDKTVFPPHEKLLAIMAHTELIELCKYMAKGADSIAN